MEEVESSSTDNKSHVAMYPGPGLSHFIPICALAKRLSSPPYNCKVTVILFSSFSTLPPASAYFASLPSTVNTVYIPEIQISEDITSFETRLVMTIQHSIPAVKDFLLESATTESPVTVLLVDFFAANMISMASALSIPTWIFVTTSLAFLKLMSYVPMLVSQIKGSFEDTEFGIEAPGLPTIPCKHMPSFLFNRSSYCFDYCVEMCRLVQNASGVLVNSFRDLEMHISNVENQPNVYTVGPLISSVNVVSDCIKWLDKQSPCSVVYVSFGSGAVLKEEQIAELAEGLERSGHRFLWVLRKDDDIDQGEMLPLRFVERTKDFGYVVPPWVPQMEIVGHHSVGAFVTHCGWNSILESIWCGVPVVLWPMFAEQKLNRILALEEYGLGVDLKMDEDGFVKREEIERSVIEVMDGEMGRKAREKAMELKEKARSAMSRAGKSSRALEEVVKIWRS